MYVVLRKTKGVGQLFKLLNFPGVKNCVCPIYPRGLASGYNYE